VVTAFLIYSVCALVLAMTEHREPPSKLLLAARIPMAIYMEISRFGFMLLIVAVSVSDFGRWMSQWSIWGARTILGALQ